MKTVYLKTTETCNLDCPHCYTSGSTGRKVYWDTDKVIDWIYRLDESLPKEESVHFEFHGGEPFICKTEDLVKVAQNALRLKREVSLGITSNLVLNLTKSRLDFIKHYIGSIGTSYDIYGRFNNEKQYRLWMDNVRLINELEIPLTLNIGLTKPLTQYPISDLFDKVIYPNEIKRLRLEKITYSGNAIVNRDIVPTNKEANQYLLQLHLYLEDNNLDIEVVNLEEIYVKFKEGIFNSGTYFRQCEQNLYTVNADGTISGCPNDAPTLPFSTLNDTIEDLNSSPKRVFQIVKESLVDERCYDCHYYRYCGGGCYKLAWDETGCPSPKALFDYLRKG